VQGPVEQDVLASGEVTPEAGAQLEQGDDLPATARRSGVQRDDPGRTRRVEDFPAPLRPTMPTVSPGAMRRLTPSSA
jgi:hypothetical protein